MSSKYCLTGLLARTLGTAYNSTLSDSLASPGRAAPPDPQNGIVYLSEAGLNMCYLINPSQNIQLP